MEATAKTLRNKHRSTQLTYLNTWDRNPMKLYAMVEVNDDQELLMNQCQHPGKIEFDKSWWTRRWNLRTDSTLNQIKQSTNVAIPIIQDSTVLPNIEPTHAIIQDSTVLPNIEPTHPFIQDSMVLQNIKQTHDLDYLGTTATFPKSNVDDELWQILPQNDLKHQACSGIMKNQV